MEEPDYRPDLDPDKPQGLVFEFSDDAQQLLQQELPKLQQQQQQLQQQAAERGLMAGDRASSSSSSSGRQSAARAKYNRQPGHNSSSRFNILKAQKYVDLITPEN